MPMQRIAAAFHPSRTCHHVRRARFARGRCARDVFAQPGFQIDFTRGLVEGWSTAGTTIARGTTATTVTATCRRQIECERHSRDRVRFVFIFAATTHGHIFHGQLDIRAGERARYRPSAHGWGSSCVDLNATGLIAAARGGDVEIATEPERSAIGFGTVGQEQRDATQGGDETDNTKRGGLVFHGYSLITRFLPNINPKS